MSARHPFRLAMLLAAAPLVLHSPLPVEGQAPPGPFRSGDSTVQVFDADTRYRDVPRTVFELPGPFDGPTQVGLRVLVDSGQAPPGTGLRGTPRSTVIVDCMQSNGGSDRVARGNIRGDRRGNAFFTETFDAPGCESLGIDVIHRGNSTIPEGGSLMEEAQAVRVVGDSCTPDDRTLCLNDGRFEVNVDWRTRPQDDNPASGLQQAPDTGYFWFFDPDNAQAIVQVLDGCQTNGHFWVFAGALTDLDFTLRVLDTQTGQQELYTNQLGRPAPPIQDTRAFATCP